MQFTYPFVAALQEWNDIFMSRSMRRFIRYSKEKGLSMSQLGALFRIHHKGSSGVADLGDDLGVTSAAASQMLEHLVQQDMILRSEDPVDRRLKQLVLTEKGTQIIQECFHAREGWLDELVKTLSAIEKEQVETALHILIEKTNRLEDSTNSRN